MQWFTNSYKIIYTNSYKIINKYHEVQCTDMYNIMYWL